jgi:hypothetical protein
MGSHLKQALGEKIFILGVTKDDNFPETVEHALNKSHVSLAWARSADINTLTSTNLFGKPSTGNWKRVVDGILYFHPSYQGSKSESKFIRGKIINGKDQQPIAFASIGIEDTSLGTASDVDGSFLLKVNPSMKGSLKISCIGYKSATVGFDELVEGKPIELTPEIALLNEVLIQDKAPNGKEILLEVLSRIKDNYLQTPFNLEFYSRITTEDTVDQKLYQLESIFNSYSNGYHPDNQQSYRIVQKRERGDYFMKERTQGFSQFPVWEIAANDIYSNHSGILVLHPDMINKINPTFAGVEYYDGDTVLVVTYDYKFRGTLYVSSRDYAILKHTTTIGGNGFKNYSEIIFRKHQGKYFPYAANGYYRHRYKVDGKKVILKITNTTSLRRIESHNVKAIANDQNAWHAHNVPYDEKYWKENFGD